MSDALTKKTLAKDLAAVKAMAGKNGTGGVCGERTQQSTPGSYIDLRPGKVKWDLSDKMDATGVANSVHLAMASVGTDVLIMRRTPTTVLSWPHILIGPTTVDLDKPPWLTFQLKDAGITSPAAVACRVIDLDTGAMAMVFDNSRPPYYVYRAFDLRKALNYAGGKHNVMLKFYYIGIHYVNKDVINSKAGDFVLLDFLRLEKSGSGKNAD